MWDVNYKVSPSSTLYVIAFDLNYVGCELEGRVIVREAFEYRLI